MNILDKIFEKEDKLLNTLIELKNCGGGYNTYIYGDGLMGQHLKKRLAFHGIACAGTVVNSTYWKKGSGNICLEELLESTSVPINLVIAFRGYQPESLLYYENKINAVVDMDCFAGMDIVQENSILTYGWLKENALEFQMFSDMLQDNLSRNTLYAYLNQKISSDYKYLKTVWQPFQYFDEGINKMSAHEVFIDCGAYDGDSAADFINALQRRGYDTYDEIISFEPDPDNYKRLKERNLKNHTCIQKGVSSERKRVYFSQQSTCGKYAESGELYIETDSIDQVIKGRNVTMIKMDIEGEELDALHGAESTIKRCRPVLAICVYHKKEDLLTIPKYIQSLVSEYKFYLRAYDRTSLELVLYAVL